MESIMAAPPQPGSGSNMPAPHWIDFGDVDQADSHLSLESNSSYLDPNLPTLSGEQAGGQTVLDLFNNLKGLRYQPHDPLVLWEKARDMLAEKRSILTILDRLDPGKDCRQSFGQTLLLTLDERIKAIQEESEQANLPNEVLPTTSHEEEVNFRIRFNICKTIVESLPTARCTPKCEKTLQALLCQNLNVKSITLENAITSRRIRLHNDIVTGFQKSVSERFLPGTTMTGSPIVELILEGLLVLRIGYKH
ncbi:hypothetical protein QJS04_geneDACA024296 [Acorus gramineus]|uniref:ATP synthase protein MI25 n=1 Tax=Acorus gramineus TaxID=55184 RepID=A0AAV9A3J9_ACOGR|nr:hypothetical protein QJS04_geneDACA024296 [Acorus gramineus]